MTVALQVEWVSVGSIKPYSRNAKKHTAEQVERVANSIREFGWQQPIVVDKDGVVVIGHARLKAAKKLGLDSVPVVHADDLSPEQVRALRLVDNKTNESAWDTSKLNLELSAIEDLDIRDFGFEIEVDLDEDEEYEDWGDEDDGRRSHLHHNVFENQEHQQFESDNFYGIPILQATQTYGSNFLRFCDWKECSDPQNYIAHFFYDDYKFISAWREPEKYLERLQRFKAVVSPDFSLYTDFPRALQILSCYRRNWCGAFWSQNGIDVIPDVIWGDEQSYVYCFEGLPKHSVVAVSSVGVKRDKDWNGKDGDLFRAGWNAMLERLEPTKILYYGDVIDGLEGDLIHIPSFYAERRGMLNEKSRQKKEREANGQG